MLFPGLRKLKNQYGLKSKSHALYGFHKNCFIQIFDRPGKKELWIDFPVKLDEEDLTKIESWQRKGYATELTCISDENKDGCFIMEFKEQFVSFKVAKIAEIIDDLTNYIAAKYPNTHKKCRGKDCTAPAGTPIDIYDLYGIPTHLCQECATKYQKKIEEANEAFEKMNDNYLLGAAAAIVFCIPGLLVSTFFIFLGRLAAVTCLVYFALAKTGYNWAKGKWDKIGALILGTISLAYTVWGTIVGTLFSIMWEISKKEEFAETSIGERFDFSIKILKEPEVQANLTKDQTFMLTLCSIGLIALLYSQLRFSGKSKISKL